MKRRAPNRTESVTGNGWRHVAGGSGGNRTSTRLGYSVQTAFTPRYRICKRPVGFSNRRVLHMWTVPGHAKDTKTNKSANAESASVAYPAMVSQSQGYVGSVGPAFWEPLTQIKWVGRRGASKPAARANHLQLPCTITVAVIGKRLERCCAGFIPPGIGLR